MGGALAAQQGTALRPPDLHIRPAIQPPRVVEPRPPRPPLDAPARKENLSARRRKAIQNDVPDGGWALHPRATSTDSFTSWRTHSDAHDSPSWKRTADLDSWRKRDTLRMQATEQSASASDIRKSALGAYEDGAHRRYTIVEEK
mmetsp:Transcript_9853/g.21908  ORF Transcript_9853/g.21908 Transcript_9853/m.21908 type:complete len:144 (+) Transcript_9853:154-585(+)